MVAHSVGDEAARYPPCNAGDSYTDNHGAKTRAGAGAIRNKSCTSPAPNPECLHVRNYRCRAGLIGAYRHDVLKPCSIRQSIGRQHLGAGNRATREYNRAYGQERPERRSASGGKHGIARTI